MEKSKRIFSIGLKKKNELFVFLFWNFLLRCRWRRFDEFPRAAFSRLIAMATSIRIDEGYANGRFVDGFDGGQLEY